MSSLLNVLSGPAKSSCGSSCGSGCGGGSSSGCGSDESRRGFLERATTMVLGGFTLTLLPMLSSDEGEAKKTEGEAEPVPSATQAAKQSKPGQPGILYGFLIDTDKCTGAGKCLTACREENRVPEGYSRTWVERYTHYRDGRVEVDLVPETGYFGFAQAQPDPAEVLKSYFVPKLCNQCVDAPCNQVCPVHASITSPEGVELVDPDRCIGCGYCVQACPYGMRFMNPVTNNADKCTWCYHRITHQENPACVEACPTGARVFGRLDDPESEISKRLASVRTQVLKEHLGTNPKLFYTSLSDEVV